MQAGLRRDFLVLVAAFVVTLPLVTARIYASDEVQYFSYLRSLWFDRDLSFENEYQHFYDSGRFRNPLFHETFLERSTDATGLRVTFATLGSALLWSPFYAAADAYVLVRQATGARDGVRDGYSQPYVTAVAYGSACYAWLAIVLGWLMARRLVGPASALLAALAVWFGTPLFFYMYIAPPMSHACSAFAVALFLLTWLRVRERWSLAGCATLGALAALMAMVREQDVFIALGPAVDWAWTTVRGSRLRAAGYGPAAIAARVGAAVASFLVCYSPQLYAYSVLNGRLGPSRLVGRKMTWTAPHALSVLFSPEHGLLVWTPLVALSLAGLVWTLIRREAPFTPTLSPQAGNRRNTLALLLAVASQVYVAGSVESWTVAGAFGQRRFVGLTAVFVVGLAMFLAGVVVAPALPPSSKTSADRRSPGGGGQRRGSLRTVAVWAVVCLAVWWNLGLTLQFGAGLMDRQRLEPRLNAWRTFVTLPARLPDLAYRYVFERSSFYRPPGAAEPSPEPSPKP